MKKKLIALMMCLAMLVPLVSLRAAAANDIYFVATEQIVLPLTEDTMPFWDNGYLYISSTIFTGLTREALKISRAVNEANDLVVLYGGGKALVFDTARNYAQDAEGKTYYPGAVCRNGNIYVPASLTARYFGLKYSVTSAKHGFLVWLRNADMVLTDQQFARAATGPMNTRYEDYLKELAAKEETETLPAPPPVTPPVVQPPVEPVNPEKPAEITGEQAYLCMEAGSQTEWQLNALDIYGAKAAFFCTEEFLTEQGGLLRRMTATGHSIGLLVDGADPERSVEEQLEAANRALARATMGKTRLAVISNGDAADHRAAENAGFRCLQADVDYSATGLKSGSASAVLLHRLAGRDKDSTVWLGVGVTSTGLRAFLDARETVGIGACPAWTETT